MSEKSCCTRRCPRNQQSVSWAADQETHSPSSSSSYPWESQTILLPHVAGMLCSGLLQSFNQGELHSVAWYNFSTKNCNLFQFDLVLSITAQAERVLGMNEAKFYINTVDKVMFLKTDAQMQFAHRIHFRTVVSQSFALCVACVVCTKRVKVVGRIFEP